MNEKGRLGVERDSNIILLIMPKLFKGGAEKQFRFLRDNIYRRNIIVVTILADDNLSGEMLWNVGRKSNIFPVHECKLFFKVLSLKKDYGFKVAIVYDLYGQYLIPFLKVIGMKVLFAERNSGVHRTFIGRSVIKMADIITTNSQTAIANLSKFIKSKQIIYIANGISVKGHFDNIVSHRDNDPVYRICLPARIDPVKNQMLALQALEMINDAELHIAGKVENLKYFKELLTYVCDHGLRDRFFFDGYIDDMVQYYYDFDLILLPSLEEGTSNVILEAYSLKKLCLMSDIEMNRSIATSEDCLFISENVEDLVKKIKILRYLDEDEKKSIIQDNYDFVCRNYSYEYMLSKYTEVLKSM